MEIHVGQPSQKQAFIIDTSSTLTSLPCLPLCSHCGKHFNSIYDMKKSNTSRVIECTEDKCNLNSMYCNDKNQCGYEIVILNSMNCLIN